MNSSGSTLRKSRAGAKRWLTRRVAPGALLVALTVSPVMAHAPDALITTRVRIALVLSMDIGATPITVETSDGRVTLRGSVSSQPERDQAERLARTIGGATEVRNQLQVAPAIHRESVRVRDAALRQRVAVALASDPRLAQCRIEVKSVRRGLVLLTGRARSPSEHLVALEIVERTPGVRGLASEIEEDQVEAVDPALTSGQPWADVPAAG